jgi:hypothetical protein
LTEAGFTAAKRTVIGTSELIREFDPTAQETVFIPLPVVLVGLLLPVLAVDFRVNRPSRARKQAEERGIALLRSWLTPEQDRQWAVRRYFEVVGCDSGTRYRITRGTVMNIHQLNPEGRKVAEWCFAPEGDVVTGDILLAQKIALETMEGKALTIANRSDHGLSGPCA